MQYSEMDTGTDNPTSSELQAVIDMTVLKADEIVGEYQRIEAWVEQAEANIKAARGRQDILRGMYGQCGGTAELFGFNLEHERQRAADNADYINNLFAETEIPAATKTVREILIDLGREANGAPLRAADVRPDVEARLGRAVHDKTVGMTLYRLSKENAFERRGYDWYFVPEAERLRNAGNNGNLAEEYARQTLEGVGANGKPPE